MQNQWRKFEKNTLATVFRHLCVYNTTAHNVAVRI